MKKSEIFFEGRLMFFFSYSIQSKGRFDQYLAHLIPSSHLISLCHVFPIAHINLQHPAISQSRSHIMKLKGFYQGIMSVYQWTCEIKSLLSKWGQTSRWQANHPAKSAPHHTNFSDYATVQRWHRVWSALVMN